MMIEMILMIKVKFTVMIIVIMIVIDKEIFDNGDYNDWYDPNNVM